jgi:hypothetical protein
LLRWWRSLSVSERRRRLDVLRRTAQFTRLRLRVVARWATAELDPEGTGNWLGRLVGGPSVAIRFGAAERAETPA